MHTRVLSAIALVVLLPSCDPRKDSPQLPQGETPTTKPDQLRLLEARLEGLEEALRSRDAEVKRLKASMPKATEAEFRNRGAESFYLGGAVLCGRDPATGDFGWIAVSICPSGAGQLVIGELGLGAAAALGVPDFALQRQALEGLRGGKAAAEVVRTLLPDSGQSRNLQLGVFGTQGDGAGFHGLGLHRNSGEARGPNSFALGCEVALPELLQLLCAEFEKNQELPLPERLLAAMREVRLAPLKIPGGQVGISTSSSDRPILSAAMVVLRKNGSLDGTTERFVDVRVDLDTEPIAALDRVYRAWEKASLVARLKAFLKDVKDPSSPRTKADRSWLDKLRAGG